MPGWWDEVGGAPAGCPGCGWCALLGCAAARLLATGARCPCWLCCSVGRGIDREACWTRREARQETQRPIKIRNLSHESRCRRGARRPLARHFVRPYRCFLKPRGKRFQKTGLKRAPRVRIHFGGCGAGSGRVGAMAGVDRSEAMRLENDRVKRETEQRIVRKRQARIAALSCPGRLINEPRLWACDGGPPSRPLRPALFDLLILPLRARSNTATTSTGGRRRSATRTWSATARPPRRRTPRRQRGSGERHSPLPSPPRRRAAPLARLTLSAHPLQRELLRGHRRHHHHPRRAQRPPHISPSPLVSSLPPDF